VLESKLVVEDAATLPSHPLRHSFASEVVGN
jgi:hypothetical protein